MKTKPLLCISATILSFFCITVYYLNESSYNWLSASTIKFTNNWLSDGISADKYTMLERPLSIEAQTFQDREPYISYPNGTVLLTYGIAKLLGYRQIDMNFIKPISIVFYMLDALLIGILIYLLLIHILKLKLGYGNIILPVFLSCLWICLPNNVYFLKNVFFSDQLVLFFIYLFLLLELLKNYLPTTDSKKRQIINGLLFLVIFVGILIEYYFWIQLFVVCLFHLVDSLKKKEKWTNILKKLSVYIIPALLAVSYFVLQIIQIEDWLKYFVVKFLQRTGQSNIISENYILRIGYSIYKPYQAIGLLFFPALFISLIYLRFKKEQSNILKFSSIVIIPVIIQLTFFINHSAVHEFSIIKLGLPFIIGIILIVYSVSLYKKNLKISSTSLTIIIITSYLFYIQWNIPNFYYSRLAKEEEYYPKGFESIIKNLNQYENVFFSFTDSISANPPYVLAQTKKMMYNINEMSDIKTKFPNISSQANLMLLVNKNADKNYHILQKEQSAIEKAELIKEDKHFAVYRIFIRN